MHWTAHLRPLLLTCLLACGSSSSTPDDEERQRDGGSSNDGDDTSDNDDATEETGGIDFTTKPRDFSSTPVVTEPRKVSAALATTHPFDATPTRFRVVGDRIIAWLSKSAFETELVALSLSTDTVTDRRAADGFVSGFDFNGAVMITEGNENLAFYRFDGGKIQDRFDYLPSFQDTIYLNECFLDDDKAYVTGADTVWRFPLRDTKSVESFTNRPSLLSAVRFTADEAHVYVVIGEPMNSTIRVIDKLDRSDVTTKTHQGRSYVGASVDGNYLYLADAKSNSVFVVNKHTDDEAGSIASPALGSIEVVGDELYAVDEDANAIHVYTLSFTDP